MIRSLHLTINLKSDCKYLIRSLMYVKSYTNRVVECCFKMSPFFVKFPGPSYIQPVMSRCWYTHCILSKLYLHSWRQVIMWMSGWLVVDSLYDFSSARSTLGFTRSTMVETTGAVDRLYDIPASLRTLHSQQVRHHLLHHGPDYGSLPRSQLKALHASV